MTLPVVSLDFETCSRIDLRKVSAWRYAEDPTTRVLCAAWAVDGGPPKLWRPGDPIPNAIWMASWGDALIAAWNASFERAILARLMAREHGWPEIPLEAMRCTMAASAFAGFPMSLDQATRALGLPDDKLKDKTGHGLMLRMARPRTKRPLTWWHETEPDRLAELERYCLQDVEAERAARLSLPARCPGQITVNGFLPDAEQEIWTADQRVNERGVAVDVDLVDALQDVVDVELARLDRQLARITGGVVQKCSNAGGIIRWINDRLAQRHITHKGEPARITTIGKDILPRLIQRAGRAGLTEIEEALNVRQLAAKSSTAKLKVLALATSHDGRLRGTLQYYGAQRTGRWAGRVFQPQNIPRGVFPKGFDVAGLIDAVLRYREPDSRHGCFETLLPHGLPVMDGVVSLLRGCLVGPERANGWHPDQSLGHSPERGDLWCPDLSQIEARVVNWLAGGTRMLKVFAASDRGEGTDPYVFAAGEIGSDSRQLGKVCTLGLGFGMGGPKFRGTAAKAPYFIKLSEAEAKAVVNAWRKANRRVVLFWRVLETAFRTVMRNPGQRLPAGQHISVESMAAPGGETDVVLWLPSGRPLYYRNCRLVPDSRWPNGVPAIAFDGVDPKTRRWGQIACYGAKFVENATQAVARDLIALALVWLEANGASWGLRPVLSVHDELVLELADFAGATPEMADRQIRQAFARWPGWAAGLPVAHETKHAPRYAK